MCVFKFVLYPNFFIFFLREKKRVKKVQECFVIQDKRERERGKNVKRERDRERKVYGDGERECEENVERERGKSEFFDNSRRNK